MATNIKRYLDEQFVLSVACSNPTTPASGDPVRAGELCGIALTDESEGGNSSGNTSVYFGNFVATFSVKGVDDSGNSAVAMWDTLFYVDGDTPHLSKKASGYFFGYAMGTVNSGSTGTIEVLHPTAASRTATVNTSDLASGAVTAAKLSTTLKTGFVLLPLSSFRLISSNDIPNSGSADGGVISQDTVPKLERINDATDKQLRIAWAATQVIGITTQFAYPPDLDDTANLEVRLVYYKGSNTDTGMVAAVAYFEGIPIEETVTSMLWPWRENGGKLAVTITAATFLSCSFCDCSWVKLTPSCDSILAIACVVNGVCVV